MKSVLVLGATGFVGTHVALAMEKENVHLVLACRDRGKLDKRLQAHETRIGDIRDRDYLNSVFIGIDIVINAFAWSSMFAHKKESDTFFLKPALHLIDVAKLVGVRRFINLSSVSATDSTRAYDPNLHGKPTSFWPHLDNVITIENHLRQHASQEFQVINLRCGHFIGKHYSIGLLPILLPRLKTHLVPWIYGGKTHIPLISDTDIAQAFVKAALHTGELNAYESFDILGRESPLFRDVLEFIHASYGYPLPHFNVSFALAHLFGHVMERLHLVIPSDPLVTRSIVHLLKETGTDNKKAHQILGYEPSSDWREVIAQQIDEIHAYQMKPMRMIKEIR